ncbi:hypothetical protein BGW80DRAFT_1391726 [Lactifluus volemus]|nr:hypothetical protein BGW80DRAFT_1391726 [Lactifluus volemus]
MHQQADYTSRTLVPSFYCFVQAHDTKRQMVYKEEFSAALEHRASLLERGERPPRRVLGQGELNWTDVMVRLRHVHVHVT